jgi:hypothetical protein
MADEQKHRKPDIDNGHTEDIEERVRLMMDPAAEEPEKPKKKSKDDTASAENATSAPVVPGLPVPKEPLKIKIIKDDDDESDPPAKKQESKPEEAEEAAEEPADEAEPDEAEEAAEPTEKEADASEKEVGPEDEGPDKEDPDTDKAVDDIVKHESDELLKAEDDKAAESLKKPQKKSFGSRIKAFFAWMIKTPKGRWTTFLTLFFVMAAISVVPATRYYLLNAAGVRASMSVQVMDESTLQPLKNVTVSVGSVSALTDTEGNARLGGIKLGPSEMKIEKRAFAPVERKVVIGWGSNPLGEFQLKPVGTQYSFVVTDFLSGKGVNKAEAVSGEASALSDENGKIKLTMDEPPDEIDVSFLAENYRVEKLTISADSKDENQVRLVPSRKHVFISKRSGKYDVYKVDIDGMNEEMVLAGTGTERDDMVLVSHPSKEIVALVSTREGKRNKDGYLLSTLTLIDLSTNSAKAVASSERVQLVDWIGDRVVYVQVAAGESASSPKRHTLMSYDHRNGDNREIAASNYFNDVLIAAGKLYYAPSSTYQPEGVNTNVFRVDGDGGNKKIILAKEAWNMFRTSYDHIAISVPNEWYDFDIDGNSNPVKLSGEPPNLANRVYVDDAEGKKALWVDTRDGKGALLVFEPATQKEDVLRTQSGLKNPIRWLNKNTAVFRIKTDQETADYAISLNGGEPKKIRDVTNTGGVDQWYYY